MIFNTQSSDNTLKLKSDIIYIFINTPSSNITVKIKTYIYIYIIIEYIIYAKARYYDIFMYYTQVSNMLFTKTIDGVI